MDALCLVDDCLEFGTEPLFQAVSAHAGTKMLETLSSRSENLSLVQTCIFGLGVLA